MTKVVVVNAHFLHPKHKFINVAAIKITQVIITAQVHFSLTHACNTTLSPSRGKQLPHLRTRPEKANGIAK